MQRRLEVEVGAVVLKRPVGQTGSALFGREATTARGLADPATTKSERKAAAKVMRDPKAGKDAKSAAASALTQKVKAKAKAKNK